MKHVVSPSLADGAFHYYEKISFQLFLITQEVRACPVSCNMGFCGVIVANLHLNLHHCRGLEILNNCLLTLER